MRVLVLGYGNPSRQDDGAGHVMAWLVARAIRKYGDEAVLWRGHQLLPEAVLEAEDIDVAVFCDASLLSYDEGYALEKVEPSKSGADGLNIHTFGPGSVLSFAAEILGRVPDGLMLSVSGDSFDFSDRLTPGCRERVRRACRSFKEFWKAYRESQIRRF